MDLSWIAMPALQLITLLGLLVLAVFRAWTWTRLSLYVGLVLVAPSVLLHAWPGLLIALFLYSCVFLLFTGAC